LSERDSLADGERCRSSTAVSSSAAATEDERSPELQRLHDELVASKLREAEAHLSMKEFEQKLLQLQRHWQVRAAFPFMLPPASIGGERLVCSGRPSVRPFVCCRPLTPISHDTISPYLVERFQ